MYISSEIVFRKNSNRKYTTNFSKSDKKPYSDPIKERIFRHIYEIKNCRESQNRALYANNWCLGTPMPPDNVKVSIDRR